MCGDQSVLVDEVIDTTRTALACTDLTFTAHTAGEIPDAAVWASVLRFPLAPAQHHLVLVRAADRLTYWDPLATFLRAGRQLPHTHLMLVSHQRDLVADGDDLPAHLELIKAKGRVVRCSALNEADAVAWVRRRHPALTERGAAHLLTRTAGKLGPAAQLCAKLNLFTGTPSTAVIDALCDPVPAEGVTDLLLALRKPAALAAAAHLPQRDYGQAIGLLDARVDLLGSLWRSVRTGLTPREVTGHPPFLVYRYYGHAKHYDPARCAHARQVLVLIDDALRAGARVGVLEALIALW